MNQTGAGQVMNLLSNDVIRFDQLTLYLNFIWIMPIQVILQLMKSIRIFREYSEIIKHQQRLSFFQLKLFVKLINLFLRLFISISHNQ